MQAGNELDAGLVAFGLRLSNAADEVLRRYFRMKVGVATKADASPVTLADREVEDTLRRMIEQTYPEHGIVGEEFGTVRPEAAMQWVIDPIDGTRAFLGGYPLFTTLIALVRGTQPILGIITQPILGERWVGMADVATTINGAPARARRTATLAEAVIATTSVDYFTPEETTKFQGLKKQCAHTVLGGDAYAYAMLATGQNDIVVDAGLKPYDFCALVPVIEGSGGVITDWQGAPLQLGSGGRVLAAATPELHALALKHLR